MEIINEMLPFIKMAIIAIIVGVGIPLVNLFFIVAPFKAFKEINKKGDSTMDQLDIDEMVDKIEEEYFKGKNLMKLIQSGRDKIVINNFNNCLIKLKG